MFFGALALAIASAAVMLPAPALAQSAQGVSIRQAASPSDCRSGEGIATRHGEFVGCARLTEPQRQRIRSREREALAAVSPDREDWCRHVYVPATNDHSVTAGVLQGARDGLEVGGTWAVGGASRDTSLRAGAVGAVVGFVFGAVTQHRARVNDEHRCELADQYYARH